MPPGLVSGHPGGNVSSKPGMQQSASMKNFPQYPPLLDEKYLMEEIIGSRMGNMPSGGDAKGGGLQYIESPIHSRTISYDNYL